MVATKKRPTYYHPLLQKGYVSGSFGMLKIGSANFVLWLTLCLTVLFLRSFELPLWVHDSIYSKEDTSDLICKELVAKELTTSVNQFTFLIYRSPWVERKRVECHHILPYDFFLVTL
jgi:hypothetical protein